MTIEDSHSLMVVRSLGAEVVSTPVVVSLLDNTLTGNIIYYE